MATIRQLESGGWQAVVRKKGSPAAYQSFPKRADAIEWAAEVERAISRGTYLPRLAAERTTFDDVATRFAEEFAPHHYRGESWARKLASLRARLGAYSLAALTPQLVGKYRDDRLKDRDSRYKKDPAKAPFVSPATVKGEIDLLSKVLDVAAKEFCIPLPAGNPVLSTRKPKGAKARDRRLTADEMTALMRECRASGNTWLAPAVVLSIETGMRQGELLSLDWKNIDRERRVALVGPGKTDEPRGVPLSSSGLEALQGLPRALSGRIIPIGRMTLYKAFERACKRASIGDFTWHDLRHEALSRLAERGDFTVLEMAAVSGHKTLQMLKRYTHLQAEKLAAKLG